MVKIPYSRLNQEIISEISDSATIEEYKFQLRVEKTRTKQETEEYIKFLILNSPWSNFNKKQIIKVISEDETTFTFEVLVNALNNKHSRQLEKSIMEQMDIV